MARIELPENGDLDHLYEVRQMANSLLNRYHLEGWRIEWDRATRRAGQCRYQSKTISLSAPLMSIWETAHCRDTILHEIAHALVGPGHGHDAEWRSMCVTVGADPTRTWGHNGEAHVQHKWEGTCRNGHVVYRDRMSAKAKRSTCGRCSRYYNPDNAFTWSKANESS